MLTPGAGISSDREIPARAPSASPVGGPKIHFERQQQAAPGLPGDPYDKSSFRQAKDYLIFITDPIAGVGDSHITKDQNVP
jgi:hypothetical protein